TSNSAPPSRPALPRGVLAAALALLGGVAMVVAHKVGHDAALSAGSSSGSTRARTADRAPRLLSAVEPRRVRSPLTLSPTIVVRLLVGRDGQVKDAQVFRPRAELAQFEAAAVEAARRYRFEPAMENGEAAESWINWPVRVDVRTDTGKLRIK